MWPNVNVPWYSSETKVIDYSGFSDTGCGMAITVVPKWHVGGGVLIANLPEVMIGI